MDNRIIPIAARLSPNGSFEPVGFWFTDQKLVNKSILSAKAIVTDRGFLLTLSSGPIGP